MSEDEFKNQIARLTVACFAQDRSKYVLRLQKESYARVSLRVTFLYQASHLPPATVNSLSVVDGVAQLFLKADCGYLSNTHVLLALQ